MLISFMTFGTGGRQGRHYASDFDHQNSLAGPGGLILEASIQVSITCGHSFHHMALPCIVHVVDMLDNDDALIGVRHRRADRWIDRWLDR